MPGATTRITTSSNVVMRCRGYDGGGCRDPSVLVVLVVVGGGDRLPAASLFAPPTAASSSLSSAAAAACLRVTSLPRSSCSTWCATGRRRRVAIV